MVINVVIVDDILVNRKTTKSKIENTEGIHVLFEAINGIDFLKKIELNVDIIDVVLMDLEMPKMNGIETIYEAKKLLPKTKFIVLTVFEDSDKIFEAVKAGANGYLLKEDTALQILEAIHNVHLYDSIPMSPSIARKALKMMVENTTPIVSEVSVLSIREKEILKLLVKGKNYKKIGDELFISPFTVRKHISNIYEKLQVNNKAQVISLAYENKWI